LPHHRSSSDQPGDHKDAGLARQPSRTAVSPYNPSVLEEVVDALVCPHCGAGLALGGGALRCAERHTFDIARQGYVSLLSEQARAGGDTAAMVAARADFLTAGHFAPIADLVAQEAEHAPEGRVLDLGAGTGHYLARALEVSGRTGLALDASKYACRRAARAHPRIGAVVANTWRQLPVRSSAVSVVLNVFAPRNAAEMHRVLRPAGHLVVVTPNAMHLAELVSELGLLNVDQNKQQRLDEQLGDLFAPVRRDTREFTMWLRRNEIEGLVAMGPSAWHATSDSLRQAVAALSSPFPVTASVTVSVHRGR
jgi:23S rRNA (guanine745-N1)-methyltransferase